MLIDYWFAKLYVCMTDGSQSVILCLFICLLCLVWEQELNVNMCVYVCVCVCVCVCMKQIWTASINPHHENFRSCMRSTFIYFWFRTNGIISILTRFLLSNEPYNYCNYVITWDEKLYKLCTKYKKTSNISLKEFSHQFLMMFWVLEDFRMKCKAKE